MQPSKLLLIVRRVAVTGGFNIASAYLSGDRSLCWFDLGIVVRGPSVARMIAWFAGIAAIPNTRRQAVPAAA